MSISGIYAISSEQTNEEAFSTSIVNIELEEFTLNNEKEEIEYNNQYQYVMPGQEIPLIERVHNLGMECYIRIKVTLVDYFGTDISNGVEVNSDEWKKYGDYYYHESTVGTDDSIGIFNSIKIPEDLSNENQNDSVTLKVIAEAIQARNLNPDYTKENPWNETEIEKCVDNTYSISNSEEKNKTTVVYENDTSKHITVPKLFFEKLSKLMPGDNISENVTIKNSTKKSAEYFLSVETNKLTDKQKELLNKVTFKITDGNGKVIYNGNLLNVSSISLGVYNLNETGNLTFEILVPEDLKNEYSILNPEITWKFSASYQDEKTGNPKTGDLKFDLSLILFFISTTGLVIVLVLMRREKKNIDEY